MLNSTMWTLFLVLCHHYCTRSSKNGTALDPTSAIYPEVQYILQGIPEPEEDIYDPSAIVPSTLK